MKRDQPSASQPTQPPLRHQYEHEVPTVIHHPEEDMTALERLFHNLLKDPARFWGWITAVVGGVLVIVVLSNYFSSSRSESTEVWERLDATQKAAEKVEIAKEYPTSSASTWALLQAASEYYQDGFRDLPSNKDAALPALKKALDLFDQVAREAPKDSPQARHAALGKARTYEARNELPKAIEQYKLVAKNWPGTPEGKRAESIAKVLEAPGAAEFYKELYAYQPAKVTLPPAGSVTLPPTMTLPGLDPLGGGLTPPTTSPDAAGTSFPFLPPPPTSTTTPAAPAEAPKAAAPAEAPKAADTPAPKTESKPAPKAETTPSKPAEAKSDAQPKPATPAPAPAKP
jgi:hypothetical protein